MADRVVNGIAVTETTLPGVLIVEPRVFADARGYFLELWNVAHWRSAGLPTENAQESLSVSTRGVLRGLHFQQPNPQGKIVTVLDGEVFDVAVDVRVGSPTFGQWTSAVLSSENHRALVVPEGFAHGFLVTSERAIMLYRCTDTYHPESERGIAWDDPELGIQWPLEGRDPVLADKDRRYPSLRSATKLPEYGAAST